MEEQEIISLIEGHIERLIREWQEALVASADATDLEAKLAARNERNELHAQGAILQLILLEINDRKENEYVAQQSRPHLSTC